MFDLFSSLQYILSSKTRKVIFLNYFQIIEKIYYIWYMNKKIENKKKKKLSFSINEKLLSKLNEYLEKEDLGKRSKYIEKLIRDDMGKRGKNIDKEF